MNEDDVVEAAVKNDEDVENEENNLVLQTKIKSIKKKTKVTNRVPDLLVVLFTVFTRDKSLKPLDFLLKIFLLIEIDKMPEFSTDKRPF